MVTARRRLGRSGIDVSAIGVGCWAMGGTGWGGGADDAESVRSLHRALDLGVNLFDTAEGYGSGRSEQVLGQALRDRRDGAVIATKFAGSTPEYIRRACEDSLRRLRTDYIDLYQFHINEFGPEGSDVVREMLEDLVAAGKIRAYGWSTDFPDRARIFAQGPHCSAIQVQLNVLDDAPEILAVCDEYDLAALNRGPLAMGLLTGKYTLGSAPLPEDDIRRQTPEWMKYFTDGRPTPQWLDRLDAVAEILREGGRTLAQGAIGWLWARSGRNLPIPGFRSVRQLEENCRALQFGPLTSAQLTEIDTLLGRTVGREQPNEVAT
jgi:aryl-alcohol dehydrogenase-like predicted oxidoreductase